MTSVIGRSALVEDRRHDDEVAVPRRGVGQDGLHRQRWGDHVLAQDVLELDGLRGRRDVVGRQLRQDRVLVEDVVELGLEPGQLGVGQTEPGEVGDVLDIGARQGGHPPDDSRRVGYDRPVQRPIIRPMTPADIDQIVAAFLGDGWGDRRRSLEFATSDPQTQPFVADDDGTVVGTGLVTVNGSAAWIGTVWVDPAWRRRGIGLALTQAAIEAGEAGGGRTLLLVATEAGRPLYEHLGFEVQTWYRMLEAPGLGGEPVDPRVRAFDPFDLPAMAVLDRAATGEDREHLHRALATPETARVLEHADGSLGGFVVRAPWGGGATIAPDLRDAEVLLHARRAAVEPDKRVRVGLLAENARGLERLLSTGWAEGWRAPRLIRGDPLAWHPEAIWGQYNLALG